MLDDKTRKMVEENIRLVPYIVHKDFKYDILQNNILEDEYISIGNLGLISACKNFDESRNAKFATYATRMIWGYINSYKRQNENLIRLPRKLVDVGVMYYRGLSQGKDIREIARENGVDQKDIEEYLVNRNVGSLDITLQDEKDGTDSKGSMIDLIESDYNLEDSVIERKTYEEKLDILKKVLPERDIKILGLIIKGITDQSKIAEILNFSQSYISRRIKVMTNIGPYLHSYYEGEISLNKFLNAIKKQRGINPMLDTDGQLKEEYSEEINLACHCLMNNPGEPLDLNGVLRESGSNLSYYQKRKVYNKVLKLMNDKGYKVIESPYGKGYRLMLITTGIEKALEEKKVEGVNKEVEKIFDKKVEEIEVEQQIKNKEDTPTIPLTKQVNINNTLLNLKDIPICNLDHGFAETLQKSIELFSMVNKNAVIDIRVREVS